MAANTEPIFIKTPFIGVATITNEVLSRGGTTDDLLDNQLLVDAGDNGALIESITAIPILDTGNLAATVLRIFVKPYNSNYVVLALPEINLPAINNISSTAALDDIPVPLYDVLIGEIGRKGLRLAAGDALYVAFGSALAAGAYNVVATGGFY